MTSLIVAMSLRDTKLMSPEGVESTWSHPVRSETATFVFRIREVIV